MPQVTVPVTVEDLLVQTSMAFGQGSGHLTITPAASRFLLGYFKPRFQRHLKHYTAQRLGMLAYGRGLGWYAATQALSRGKQMIDAVDARVALEKFPCPIAPPVLALLDRMRRQEEPKEESKG
jgi:hypothetical protein